MKEITSLVRRKHYKRVMFLKVTPISALKRKSAQICMEWKNSKTPEFLSPINNSDPFNHTLLKEVTMAEKLKGGTCGSLKLNKESAVKPVR